MKRRILYFYSTLLLMSTLILFLTGCPKKPPVKVPVPEADTSKELFISDKEFQSIPELATINFNFDKFDLTGEVRKKLQDNADFLKEHPELGILVEGHCCECGTNEYNLALGQKRAKVVRDYYIKLGIPANALATISYGEEKPININAGPPDSSLCIMNRRTETKARRKTVE